MDKYYFPDEPHPERWQYGLVLWRTVLILEHREALLSAFEGYVVMWSVSHRSCNDLRVYAKSILVESPGFFLCMFVALCLQIHSCMRVCGTQWRKVGDRLTPWFGSQPGIHRKDDACNNHVPRLRSTNNKVVDDNKQRAEDAAARCSSNYPACVPQAFCGGLCKCVGIIPTPIPTQLPGVNSCRGEHVIFLLLTSFET